MNDLLGTFFASLRNMNTDLLALMLASWVTCIPFVFFTMKKIIGLIRKIY